MSSTAAPRQPDSIGCALACVVGLALITVVVAIAAYYQITTLHAAVVALGAGGGGGGLAKRAVSAASVADALRERYAL